MIRAAGFRQMSQLPRQLVARVGICATQAQEGGYAQTKHQLEARLTIPKIGSGDLRDAINAVVKSRSMQVQCISRCASV